MAVGAGVLVGGWWTSSFVAVGVRVAVRRRVGVMVAVGVSVGVCVKIGVDVMVAVDVDVAVLVGFGVGVSTSGVAVQVLGKRTIVGVLVGSTSLSGKDGGGKGFNELDGLTNKWMKRTESKTIPTRVRIVRTFQVASLALVVRFNVCPTAWSGIDWFGLTPVYATLDDCQETSTVPLSAEQPEPACYNPS